jgi:hypothetical protein
MNKNLFGYLDPEAPMPGFGKSALDVLLHNGVAERRRSKRIRTSLRSGQLYDMRENLLADCQIRNRSTGGARLHLRTDIALPAHFKLHDDMECTLVEVELRWRNKREIGVRFISHRVEDQSLSSDKIRTEVL